MDFLRSQLTSGIADEVQKALVTIQGHVWQLAQHATGCRLVQLALETGCHEAALLTKELHGHVQEAAVSPHANYVIQKVRGIQGSVIWDVFFFEMNSFR